MTKQEYILTLEKYLLPKAAAYIADLFWNEKKLTLKLKNPRKSKYGDYSRPSAKRTYHVITVNNNLQVHELLVTLLHEYAHYQVFLTIQNSEPPHGSTWRNTFRMLLQQAMQNGALPNSVHKQVQQHYFERENIASGMCKGLRTEQQLKSAAPSVSSLPSGTFFLLEKKVFQKQKKLRTRFECKELVSKKMYRVHGDALVDYILTADDIKKLKIYP